MNCTELLSHLSDYFDGEISQELKTELEAHTAGCTHCEVVVDTTRQTISVYKGTELYELSPELREHLHTAIMARCLARK